jgi:hypothetical protein
MLNIFVPVKKQEGKASIRGLWINEAGKLCYDYLRLQEIEGADKRAGRSSIYYLESIKQDYKQEAIAFIKDGIFGLYFNPGNIKLLPKVLRLSIGKNKKNLKGLIKKLLKDYKGLTIYKEALGYTLEAYYD